MKDKQITESYLWSDTDTSWEGYAKMDFTYSDPRSYFLVLGIADWKSMFGLIQDPEIVATFTEMWLEGQTPNL